MDQRVETLIRERNYVDGAWIGEPTLSVTNKATGKEIAKVPMLDAKQTRAAIEAASAALPAWSKRDRKSVV